MEWLRENWFWVAVAVFFLWIHTKMHGSHGGHGGHGGGCGGGGHQHGGDQDPARRPEEDERAEQHTGRNEHARH